MSRDVSPEICGWCGVEEPCGCPEWVDSLAKPAPAHDGPEDLGGLDDMDGDETDLTAAREAIRVLLGDAGLDGLGDLTTADGRSVVDIVRRGMGT